MLTQRRRPISNRVSLECVFPAHLGFSPDPGPRWQPSDFDFDRDYPRLQTMNSLYFSTNPNLRNFETVERTMGGAAATRDFFRLFLLPGREHCGGGDGAWAVDYLTYLDGWVENGVAPDSITTFHPKNSNPDVDLQFPLAPDAIGFSRPAYPYPARTVYRGKGDPNSANSFEARGR